MPYTPKTWENKPSTASPINATNLNHMEGGIKTNDDNIIGAQNAILTLQGEMLQAQGDISVLETLVDSIFPVDTESGNPAVITDAFGGACKSLKLTLEPIQSGSGTPSPQNVRPISGRTQSVVTRTGKNLLDPTLNTGSQVGVTFTNDNGVLTLNGTATQTTNLPIKMRIDTGATFWLPVGEYVFSAEGLEKGVHVGTTYNGAYVQIAANITGNSVSFTINENTASDYKEGSKILVGLYIGIENGKIYNNQKVYPMVRPSSIADTTYEPYNGESITRTYGQTIYGGSDDVTGDGVAVTWAKCKLSDLTWNTQASAFANFKSSSLASLIKKTNSEIVLASDSYLADSNNGAVSGRNYQIYSNSDGEVKINDTRYSTTEDFMSAMGNSELCYVVSTPTSIPLTAQNITLLHGNNVLTTDADSIEASYSADIALYIAKKIAEGSQGNRSLSKGGSGDEEVKEEEIEVKEAEIEIKEAEPLTKEVR